MLEIGTVAGRSGRAVRHGPLALEAEKMQGMCTTFRTARHEDLDALLILQRPYYEADGYAFSEQVARRALEGLVENPNLGRLWVAVDGVEIVGYLAVTLGFSLEFGGRDAFIDELAFAESHRGKGLGGLALELAEDYARQQDVRALHLEVERHLEGAQRLYRRAGFVDQDRFLLTKRLDDPSA